MTAEITVCCPDCIDIPLENVKDGYGTCPSCGNRWELPEDDTASEDGKTRRSSQATVLVKLAIDSGAVFFHTPSGECYAGVPVAAHVETLLLRGKAADTWLRLLYYMATDGKAPGGAAVAEAMAILRGQALYRGGVEDVYVRIAGHNGSIIIDIGDADWQVIEVTADGWQVLPRPPVRFRRPRGLLSLPIPQRGGSIEELHPFLNVADEDDSRILVTVLVAAMFPTGAFPILVLNGEQGAAKSTAARVFRALIDPNGAAVRSAPRDERDLAIAANNSWVLSLDNISALRDWLSDALCRISTGGGFASRTLYENDEETIFDSQRPIVINGISDVTTRGDLADRALVIHLPAIGEKARRAESEFWLDFDAAKPRILGALLDVLSFTLRALPAVNLERLPRMADFAIRGAAMAQRLGWSAKDFLTAYAGTRHTAGESVLEASLIADYIIELADWTGTASDLLERLESLAPESIRKKTDWPKTAQTVANEMRRLAPALRGRSIEVEFRRSAGSGSRRIITVREMPPQADAAVASDATISENGDALRHTATPDPLEASHAPRYESDGCDACDGSMQDIEENGEWAEKAVTGVMTVTPTTPISRNGDGSVTASDELDSPGSSQPSLPLGYETARNDDRDGSVQDFPEDADTEEEAAWPE